MQNKALRAIDNQTYNSPTGPICLKYNVVKVNDLVDIELSKMSYQLSKNSLPSPIQDLFKKGRDFHRYNTRYRYNAVVAKHKSAIYKFSM